MEGYQFIVCMLHNDITPGIPTRESNNIITYPSQQIAWVCSPQETGLVLAGLLDYFSYQSNLHSSIINCLASMQLARLKMYDHTNQKEESA